MKRSRRFLSALLTLVLLLTCASAAAETSVLDVWAQPGADTSVNAKPMLRFWFPDAGAGLTQEEIEDLHAQGLTEFDEEYLYEVVDIIHEVYDAGFGGVEMTMLADSANYGTELVSEIGWGSEAWVRILCQALATGNSLGAGDGASFKVDVTLTAHWPLIIDTIDPNDAAQQQELSYAIQDIDPEALEDTIALQLPAQKTQDGKSGVFLFTDTLVGVAVAKSKQVEVEVEQRGFPGGPGGEQAAPQTTTELQDQIDFQSLTALDFSQEEAFRAGVPEGAVIYQYTDGRYYDSALAGTGDALGDPLKDGERLAILPSEEYHTFVDEENGGYIYIVDSATGEALDADGLTYERIDESAQMGPMVSYSSRFAVAQDGEDISDAVTVYFDSGVATNMAGLIIAADGSSTQVSTIANASRASFGIVSEVEVTDEEAATQRQYMDDVQYCYAVSGADVEAAIEQMEPLQEGECYVLVPVYRRGSGQVSSGGGTITMDGRTYCVSYYTSDGAQAVIDYWEENMLDLPVEVYDADGEPMTVTLREMLAANSAGSLFEDSLEMSVAGSIWSATMLEDFADIAGYDAEAYLPLIAGLNAYNDEDGAAQRVQEDYENVKEVLFNERHVKVISDWANEVGGGYRFQSGSDDARDSTYVDVIEADNGSLSSVLKAAGTVVAKGDPENAYLSMEAITSTTIDPDYYTTMIELNMNFVRGINRIVIHGIPFTKSLNGHINVWPGWIFGEPSLDKGYGAWDSRQPFYAEKSDIRTFTDYTTRIQGLLQEGETCVPVMIVGNATDAAFAALRENGWHYNVTSEYGMMFDNMSPENIVDGVLHPDGMATQMVVLADLGDTIEQYAFLERMLAYADAGVKVVIYGDTYISRLAGADHGEYDTIADEKQTDAYAQELFAELLAHPNTISGVTTTEGLLELFAQYVDNTISFNASGLEAVRLREGADDFYLFYNSALADGYEPIAYGGVGEGLDLDNVLGVDVSTDVTLRTNGANVYALDPYTGKAVRLRDYTDNGDGTITLQLDIAAWDTAVLAVTQEAIEGAVEEHAEAGEPVLDLTDADWDLTIESYGPATDFDPEAQFNETAVSTLAFENVQLGLWKDLADRVTREQLLEIGITDEKLAAAASEITGFGEQLLNGESLTVDGNAIQYVSGIGTYTTTFDWQEDCEGAVIRFSHEDSSVASDARVNGDMVTRITISNEKGTFTFTGINALTDEVDIGDALAAGENTIEVRLVTTLRDREWIEGTATGPSYNDMQTYGLTSLSIATY